MLEKVKKAVQERLGKGYAIWISEATINHITSSKKNKVIFNQNKIRIYLDDDMIVVETVKEPKNNSYIKLISGFGYEEPVNAIDDIVL